MIQKFKNKLNKDANLKELLSGSAVTFVIKITGMLIGYVVVLMVSRKYGAEGTGIYTLTSSFLNSLAIFGAMGLNVAVLRYVGQFNKDEDGIGKMKILYKYMLQMAFPFTILVGIILYFFATEIAMNIFENNTYTPALKVGAIALPFFTLNLIQVEFIRGLKKLKISEFLRSINRPLVVIIILLFSIFNFGVLDAVYAFVVGLLLSFLLSSVFIYNFFENENGKGKNEETSFTRKELFTTSVPMMTTTMAATLSTFAAPFFLEMYSTTDQVGVFNVSLRLAQLVGLILLVVNTIVAPKFAELFWMGKTAELQKLIHQTTKIVFWISLIISISLVLLSKVLLGMFGEEFIVGSWILIILIIGQLVNAATGSVGILLNMTGYQKVARNANVITLIINLVAYIFLTPIFGITGVAIISAFGVILTNVSLAIFAKRSLKITTYYFPFSLNG